MREVLARELRANARRPRTYWTRVAVALAALAYVFSVSSTIENGGGRDLFFRVITIATALCVVEGARRATGAIADEKQEGTFGLLLLTKLSGREIIFGKFASLLFQSLQLLLVVAPIFAIPVLLGGVSVGDFLRSFAPIWHVLFISVATALCASALLPTALSATMLTLSATLFWAFFFAVAAAMTREWRWLMAINPLTPLIWTVDRMAGPYWVVLSSMATAHGVLLWAMHRIGLRLREEWRAEQRFKIDIERHERLQSQARTRAARSPWFRGNAIAWLTLRELSLHGSAGGIAMIAGVLAFGFQMLGFGGIPLNFICGWFLVFFIAAGSPLTIARMRRDGGLELVLTTPMSPRKLIAGHFVGVVRAFGLPAAILLLSLCALIWKHPQYEGARMLEANQSHLLALLCAMLVAPIVGLWSALTAKTPARAAIKTVFLVVILPATIPFTQPFYYPVVALLGLWINPKKPSYLAAMQ